VTSSGLGFAARKGHIETSDFIDRKALSNSFDGPERRQQGRQAVLCDAEHLDVNVLRRLTSQLVTYPPSYDERSASGALDDAGDLQREVDRCFRDHRTDYAAEFEMNGRTMRERDTIL
jgi:hypothetical protein